MGQFRKFRKKPVVIEAILWDGTNVDEVLGFILPNGEARRIGSQPCDGILIGTLEGEMRADKGDWIIKGIKGEFYPCKPDIFDATYEPVEAGNPLAPTKARSENYELQTESGNSDSLTRGEDDERRALDGGGRQTLHSHSARR